MRILILLLSVQLQAQVCMTDWFCTNGGGKTFIVPYSDMLQDNFYTIHHLDFGDGSDTSFIGEYNPIAVGYQAISHTYDVGIYIATLTTSFYDSTSNLLICTKVKEDTVCPYNTINSINEIEHIQDNKIYNLNGIELFKKPKGIYIKNRRKYYEVRN